MQARPNVTKYKQTENILPAPLTAADDLSLLVSSSTRNTQIVNEAVGVVPFLLFDLAAHLANK